jgi:hypothetical protein
MMINFILRRISPIWISIFSYFPQISADSTYVYHHPQKSFDFVNSIGVNTHFGYRDSQYHLYDEVLKPRLLELGVKHIRDGTYNADVVEKYKDVGTYGVKLLLITSAVDAIRKVEAIGSVLWGVEAINEPDRRKPAGAWEDLAKTEQQQLFSIMHAHDTACSIPVVGFSLANIKDNPVRIGDLSQWMDYGNIHPYAAGQYPANHWGRGLSMEKALSLAHLICKDKPLLVTECGYHNKIDNPNHPGVSETAAAIYQLHMQFVYFNQGIMRSYKYELLDYKSDPDMLDMECHFGMIRSDGTPKPIFYTMKNLLSILSDNERNFSLKPLVFNMIVPDGEEVNYTLLQKTDGSWWIALLRNISIFDLDNKQDIDVSPITVKLRFKHRPQKINIYVPNDSDKPLYKYKGKYRYNIEIKEKVLLVEIRP